MVNARSEVLPQAKSGQCPFGSNHALWILLSFVSFTTVITRTTTSPKLEARRDDYKLAPYPALLFSSVSLLITAWILLFSLPLPTICRLQFTPP